MIEHKLKIWPQYFDDVDSGRKTFEVRKLDRLFAVGDTLLLREWSPTKWSGEFGYSGRATTKQITYLMQGGQWGLLEGNCILGIKSIDKTYSEQDLLEAWELGGSSAYNCVNPAVSCDFDSDKHKKDKQRYFKRFGIEIK